VRHPGHRLASQPQILHTLQPPFLATIHIHPLHEVHDKGGHATLLVTTIIPGIERGELRHRSEGVEENLTIMTINATAVVVPMNDAVARHRMTVDGIGRDSPHYPDKVSNYNAFCLIWLLCVCDYPRMTLFHFVNDQM